jgi:hypothetical protein
LRSVFVSGNSLDWFDEVGEPDTERRRRTGHRSTENEQFTTRLFCN